MINRLCAGYRYRASSDPAAPRRIVLFRSSFPGHFISIYFAPCLVIAAFSYRLKLHTTDANALGIIGRIYSGR